MKAYQVFDENLINDSIKYKIGKKYRKSELLNQKPFWCYKVIGWAEGHDLLVLRWEEVLPDLEVIFGVNPQ